MSANGTQEVLILDHGSLRLVESWGSDQRIVEAARMSTGKGFLGWGPKHKKGCGGNLNDEGRAAYKDNTLTGGRLFDGCAEPGDEKLLLYLWSHKHMTPFEMAGATFEVQAPIFVFREWHRHRTQSYNEASARYAPLPDVNYIPNVDNVVERMRGGGKNKQAAPLMHATPGTPFRVATDIELRSSALAWTEQLEIAYMRAEDLYQNALARGVPKELARLILPVGRYSKMRAQANLRNWLQFLTLRCAADAQWEIREYALAVRAVLEELFPRTMRLFIEGDART